MSQDEPTSRKEKKALRDADRRKKGKKRKHEEITEDGKAEEQDEFDKDFLPLDSSTPRKRDRESKDKSSKPSSKKRKAEEMIEPAQLSQPDGDAQAISTKSKKRKSTKEDDIENGAPNQASSKPTKRKKTKHDVIENDASKQGGDAQGATTKPSKRKKAKQDDAENATSDQEATPSDKTHRFILFVGNLPYGATDATIRTHFKKLEPFTLRHRTDPKTGKSKGFAFLEFENYDRMKTCLKLYHHSIFDPDKVDAVVSEEAEADQEDGERQKKLAKTKKASKGARRINVELTAGGGGKAEGRKEKIRVKNERLGEQRQRRAETERKEREKKAREEGEADAAKSAKKSKKLEKVEKVKNVETKSEAAGMPDVHPSRLARIAA